MSIQMSNHKADEKEAARNRKRLMQLIKLPENAVCSDCPNRLAQNAWASINIGAFICFQCSGIHRNLGVHISKVRSLNLDSWNDDWVENMERWGNQRAKQYWEAKAQGARRPTQDDSNSQNHVLKNFIRDKYQEKLWVAGPSPEQWLAASGGGGTPAKAPEVPAARTPAPAPAPAPKAVAPAPAPAPTRVQVAKRPANSGQTVKAPEGPDLLGDFDEVIPAPANAGGNNWDSFTDASAGNNGFTADFGSNADFAAPQAPIDKKDNIMNMFNVPAQQQQMGMGGLQMGMQQMNMGVPTMMGAQMNSPYRPMAPPMMGMPQQGMMGGMRPQMPQQGMMMGGMMGGMPQQGMMGGMGGMQPQGGMMGGMPQQGMMGGMGGMQPQAGMMGGMPQQGMMMGGMQPQGGMMGGMPQQGMMMGGMPQPQGGMMGGMSQQGMMGGMGGSSQPYR